MFQSFNKQDDILKNTEEVPVTVPVYEGYLYWYSEKQKWKWHLFRFDGLSFICLSTRKVKLPRDTPIEQDDDDIDHLKHAQLPSPTSPLLATPKHPYTEDNNVVMASHYQLPSWSVNLLQVTSISLLALNDKSQQRNCFCIRTTDNKCYLLKTRKHKDLDRWLFILTKSWQWAQIQQQLQAQQHPRYLVSRSSSPPPQLPPLNISPTCDETKKLSNGPPTPPPHFDKTNQQKSQHEYYEPNYTSPILSAEKEKWIDEWRDSLQSMAMPSPMCHRTRHSTPIVLDDHDYSPQKDTAAGILSPLQQQQQQQCNRQRPASMPFLPLANHQPSSFVKKKRSDEVKNWMSSPSPQGQRDYDVQYFQDVNTTEYANDTSTHHNSNHSGNGDKNTTTHSPLLHYHRSTRGRNVQIITNNRHLPSQKPTIDNASSTPPFDNHSPLHVLSKAESTHDVYKLQSSTINHQQQACRPMNTSNSTNTANIHGMYYHPQRSSSHSVAAPSLPPIMMSSRPSYYGISSSLPLKPQCSTSGNGGTGGTPIVFHPARSTPTAHGIALVDSPHGIVKSSTPSLIPTLSFPSI